MTRLLVSVRDAAEAQVAVQAGADLIDIKEPRRGSLGAADLATIAEIVDIVDGWRPVSVALGELIGDHLDPRRLPSGVSLAKIGLSNAISVDWSSQWEKLLARFPESIAPVAVVYADAASARSPDPQAIVDHAARLGCAAVLVDTFEKHTGPTLTHWSIEQLTQFIAEVRSQGMLAVAAGGITESLLPQIIAAEPDIIAVRGAACQGDRSGIVCPTRIARLRELIDAAAVAAAR